MFCVNMDIDLGKFCIFEIFIVISIYRIKNIIWNLGNNILLIILFWNFDNEGGFGGVF